jgi:hypothetical protein
VRRRPGPVCARCAGSRARCRVTGRDREGDQTRVGYKLATEGFAPKELIGQAVLAEQAGFDFVEMSDLYHPWMEAQGHAATRPSS